MEYLSDLEIARRAKPLPITEVAARAGIALRGKLWQPQGKN